MRKINVNKILYKSKRKTTEILKTNNNNTSNTLRWSTFNKHWILFRLLLQIHFDDILGKPRVKNKRTKYGGEKADPQVVLVQDKMKSQFLYKYISKRSRVVLVPDVRSEGWLVVGWTKNEIKANIDNIMGKPSGKKDEGQSQEIWNKDSANSVFK